MGDQGIVPQDLWMPPAVPKAQSLGKANIYPLGGLHAVSVSLPTWESVIGLSRKEKWVIENLDWSYPRFYMNKPVRDLSDAVLRRLKIAADGTVRCMVFSSVNDAQKCATTLNKAALVGNAPASDVIHFSVPSGSD
ncbi:Cystathionine gamma-synthase [Cladobotryum mycophilum]|uniref:Cystathionine gamma-synthase n=1 Tax=Cladobotryum mycophilum TaxID=491253 RepID=A0ABR0SR91_9HYPO